MVRLVGARHRAAAIRCRPVSRATTMGRNWRISSTGSARASAPRRVTRLCRATRISRNSRLRRWRRVSFDVSGHTQHKVVACKIGPRVSCKTEKGVPDRSAPPRNRFGARIRGTRGELTSKTSLAHPPLAPLRPPGRNLGDRRSPRRPARALQLAPRAHEVAHAEGPERIAMEWWRDDKGHTLTRDYFRVERRPRHAGLALPRRPLRPRNPRHAGSCTASSHDADVIRFPVPKAAANQDHSRPRRHPPTPNSPSPRISPSCAAARTRKNSSNKRHDLGYAGHRHRRPQLRWPASFAPTPPTKTPTAKASSYRIPLGTPPRLQRRHAGHPRLPAPIAPPTAACAACSPSATSAPKKATASSSSTI